MPQPVTLSEEQASALHAAIRAAILPDFLEYVREENDTDGAPWEELVIGNVLSLVGFDLESFLMDVWNVTDNMDEPHACDVCSEIYDEARGDGYNGRCPSCADASEPTA